MPKYNQVTGTYEYSEKEKALMAEKRKTKPILPDRYTPGWELPTAEPQPMQQFTVRAEDFATFGRIETQVEGGQEVTLREMPIPPLPEMQPALKPEWKIEALVCLKGGAGFKARVSDGVSGKVADVGFETYYDTYQLSRNDVQAIGKALLKTYEEKGIEVTTQRRTPKPDMMEEMYQLLSIMMADPNVAEKYDSSWQTVKMQFDNSIL